jgi:ethanolamine utilization microcompartment shell protein EutS
VGSTKNDWVGSIVTALTNGSYVVSSTIWNNGAATHAGATTRCSGTLGCIGTVSASNSLVGSTVNDQIGSAGVTVLPNGNYVVSSSNWDNGAAEDVGAVTWCSGTVSCTGAVSASNSLVSSTVVDLVGNLDVTALTNGNYVVGSSNWHNGAASGVGAVTRCSGTAGCTGVVSVSNSLVGSTTNDHIGYSVTALTNGNYVVGSSAWDNGAATDVGAAKWCSGKLG